MAFILKPKCSFSWGYFQCKLPEGMVDVEVKIRTMRGIHTFQRDCTTQIISCKPWSPQQHPYPSLAKKMKTYLELKGLKGQVLALWDSPCLCPIRPQSRRSQESREEAGPPTEVDTKSGSLGSLHHPPMCSPRRGKRPIPHLPLLTLQWQNSQTQFH